MSDSFNPARDPVQGSTETGTADEKLLARARADSRRNVTAWMPSYQVMEDDLQFLAGRQWDPADVQDRINGGHVTLTINDLPQYHDQIVGDLIMNETQIHIDAADWGASDQKFMSNSGREYSSQEVRAGLIRQIEYKCRAPIHYNLAASAAAQTGLGWLRIRTAKDDPDSFAQSIIIERIKNRWSVLIDCMAQSPDFSDSDNAMVGEWMPRDEFNERWPGQNPTPIGADDMAAWWMREDFVRVCDYYFREKVKINRLLLDNGVVVRSDDKKAWEEANRLPSERIVDKDRIEINRVRMAKISYHDVLEKPVTLPGQIIPIIPVIGKRFEGSDDDYMFGIVRFAKEPKRMENYWLSSATERISLMPTAPWLVTAEMVKGYDAIWAQANSGTAAYLPYNPDPAAPGGPQRQMPPSIPQGEMQMMLAFGEKVKATVGFHDAGIGRSRNEQSGVAIEKLQRESDVGAFVFTKHRDEAVALAGRITNDWLSSIYDTEQTITIRHVNDETDTIEINKLGDDGKLMNDMVAGRYDVRATSGPAYTTIREEAASSTLTLMDTLSRIGQGEKAAAIADIAVENMDIPGHERIAARLRKMVPPALLDEAELTEEERNAPPPPPSPEQLAQNAMAEVQAKKSQADMATADAKIATAEATKATAAATIEQARADYAAAESAMVGHIVGGPEAQETADQELADAKRAEAAKDAAAKPAAAAEPVPDDPAMQALVTKTVADVFASVPEPGQE